MIPLPVQETQQGEERRSAMKLLEKIHDRSATVGVIGLGMSDFLWSFNS